MINRALPPVLRDNGMFGEVLEAFAYTYLAYYTPSAPTTPQLLSYARAWGWDSIKFVPGDGANRPDYLMAFYTQGNAVKVVVAITGVSNVIQFFRAYVAMNGVRVGSLPGLVANSWKLGADAVKASIEADPDYIGLTYRRPVSITFTGFSRGAAIAEVCCAQFAAADAFKSLRVIKFASPRTGNYNWQANKLNFNYSVESYYCHDDPIRKVPNLVVSMGLGDPGFRNACYLEDADAVTFDFTRQPPVQGHDADLGFITTPAIVAQYPGGRFVYHSPQCYRKMFARIADADETLNRYRFCFLEHADENTFQYVYITHPYVTTFTPTLEPPYGGVTTVPAGFFSASDPTRTRRRPDQEDDFTPPPVGEPPPEPVVLAPPAAPPGAPTWNNTPMAIRNRTRAR